MTDEDDGPPGSDGGALPDGGTAPDDRAVPDGGTAPAEAFALIGNEIRAEILGILGAEPYAGLSFSELRSRVDADLDSSQFNYHLQQLVGQFVEKTDDGYEMRPEGVALYRTIRAGTFNRRATAGPLDAGFDCYFCEGRVEASYADGTFAIQCPDCAHVYTETMAPPSAVADEEAALANVDQYNRHRLLAAAQGVCTICANGLDTSFVPGEDVWTEGSERLDVFVATECGHCGNQRYTSVGLALLYHPSLVAFLHDRGLDVTAVPHWELEWAMTDRHTTVRSTDPWAVALTVSRGGDTLELVVDEALNVVEENRS